MSRLAVKEFVAAQLNNLDVPVPVMAYFEMPKETYADSQIVAVVKDPRVVKGRLTLGRPSASKQADHQVQIDLYWIVQDEQGSGVKWDVFLDSIDSIFETGVTIPVALVDPETGATSNLIFIGEQITTEVLDSQIVTDADGNAVENQVLLSATKLLTAQEIYTG